MNRRRRPSGKSECSPHTSLCVALGKRGQDLCNALAGAPATLRHEFPKGLSCRPGTQPGSLCCLGPGHTLMHLQSNLRPFSRVGVFVPTCRGVGSCCSGQNENYKFFCFCIPGCISQFKGNVSGTQCSIHGYIFGFVSWALCVQEDSWGCQHPTPPWRPPQAAASSRCPSLSALSCCLQDLPPAAVSMDAFPRKTRANSGCAFFCCLQAVLENSFASSAEITWGIADPFPGYHRAASQAVARSSISHPDSPASHSPVGTQVCLRGGPEHPWCPQRAVCL